jgi:hypothetical protein
VSIAARYAALTSASPAKAYTSASSNIRNIALNAAFLAAATDSPVTMRHLLDAATVECGKLEKSLTPVEIGGWL